MHSTRKQNNFSLPYVPAWNITNFSSWRRGRWFWLTCFTLGSANSLSCLLIEAVRGVLQKILLASRTTRSISTPEEQEEGQWRMIDAGCPKYKWVLFCFYQVNKIRVWLSWTAFQFLACFKIVIDHFLSIEQAPWNQFHFKIGCNLLKNTLFKGTAVLTELT